MSERISSLVDGELESDVEIDRVLRSLGENTAQREQWDAYHLIGDALRATHGTGLPRDEFARRLAAEPTVLAPRQSRRSTNRVSPWPLRIAASIAAIAFVGWTAGSFFESPIKSNQLAGTIVRPSFVSTTSGGVASGIQAASGVQSGVSSIQPVPMVNVASPPMPGTPNAGTFARQEPLPQPGAPVAIGTNAALDDYMWAHQRYSPASLMRDVAPYVRLISGRGTVQ